MSWPISQSFPKKLELISNPDTSDTKSATDVNFHPCLKFGEQVRAVRSNASWEITCILSRPQGIARLGFHLTAGDPKWTEFEQVIDALLPRFSVALAGGSEIVVLSNYSRPSEVIYNRQNVTVTIRNPGL